MKADIDRWMGEYALDAIIVYGDESPNTMREYLTNRAKAGGMVIKKRGEAPLYIVNPMEIDEAAKSGLTVKTFNDFNFPQIYRKHLGDMSAYRRESWETLLRMAGISGRVGFYGVGEVNTVTEIILNLIDSDLGIEVVAGGDAGALFGKLYETKDEQEVAALRETASLANEVVRRVWEFIAGHKAEMVYDAPLTNAAGEPLTIGAVKAFMKAQEIALGLENPDGAIFAQGRDAAIPHSHGEDAEVLRVGRTIVYDYFPRGAENGYFHDMTRTWCIGMATEEVTTAYDEVMHILRESTAALKLGTPMSTYQVMTCDFFEARGHKTARSHPGTMEGYVHSLGHGIGLNVHESPSLREGSKNIVEAGNILTIEPGLYYPEKGWGIRVEDTVYIDEAGMIHNLTPFRYDLVLPLKG